MITEIILRIEIELKLKLMCLNWILIIKIVINFRSGDVYDYNGDDSHHIGEDLLFLL